MTTYRSRLAKLEQHHREQGPQEHDLCLELFNARQWTMPTGVTPPLSCFHGDAEHCPHRAWVEACRRRDAGAAELFDLIDELEGETPPDPAPLSGGLDPFAHYAARLPLLEARLAAVKGREI